jgi:excisionase family DNA binding protein
MTRDTSSGSLTAPHNPIGEEEYMSINTITCFAELPVVLTMGDVQRTLRCAKKTAYDLAHKADFPAIRLGRTIRVPREAFLLWLDQQAGVEGERV